MMSFLKTRTFAYLQIALSAAVAGLSVSPARADDFALSVSPPRFELATQATQTVRAVAEISNASGAPTELNFATSEWELTPDGGVALSNDLKPNSCRPWVAIERRQVTLQAGAQLRYRFEVTPPADTPPTECRFAILISGAEERVSPGADVSFPINGQIALIVYVAVGDVKPQLRITQANVVSINGVMTPVLMVENSCTAHGRLSAFLSGTDATGKRREFAPSTLPIMPGETRMIALNEDNDSDAIETQNAGSVAAAPPAPIVYPLSISGTMNDSLNTFSFEGTFEP